MDGIAAFFKGVLPSVSHIPHPKLLTLDGHASHISPGVISLAKENNVHMLCFPSNSTHIGQPIDVAVLRPAKTVFRDVVEEDGLQNNFRAISTSMFANLFKKVVDSGKAFLRRHVVAAFEATGENEN